MPADWFICCWRWRCWRLICSLDGEWRNGSSFVLRESAETAAGRRFQDAQKCVAPTFGAGMFGCSQVAVEMGFGGGMSGAGGASGFGFGPAHWATHRQDLLQG
jgi:hypothetical protein